MCVYASIVNMNKCRVSVPFFFFFFSFFFLSTYTIILGIYFTFKRYITRTIRTVTSLPFCLDSPSLPYPPFRLCVSLTLYISLVFLLFLLSLSLLFSWISFRVLFLFLFFFLSLLHCSGTSDANVKKNPGSFGVHARMRTDALGFSIENSFMYTCKSYSVHGINRQYIRV